MESYISNNVDFVVITNLTLEPYLSKILKKQFLNSNVNVRYVRFEDYLSYDSKQLIKNADMIILWVDLSVLYPDLSLKILNGESSLHGTVNELVLMFVTVIEHIQQMTSKEIIVFSQDYYQDKTNVFFGNIVQQNNFLEIVDNKIKKKILSLTTMIDLSRIMAKLGIDNCYNDINTYRWGGKYSDTLIQVVAEDIYKQYLVKNGITPKCIVLDCDNVLWGGILSEDGFENLELSEQGEGRRYQDFQRFILNLHYRGIILAIVSKNDYDDIEYMFQHHSAMIIKPEHIACYMVNWNNKSDNILSIAKSLNIGLDSIVFVDDSLFEVNLIKSTLPDVKTILYTNDSEVYSKFSFFNLPEIINTEEIIKRINTYRVNQEREKLKISSPTYENYLKELKTVISIKRTSKTEIKRLSELSQRTNQCTNGVRFTSNDLVQLFCDCHSSIYSVHVEDKYGDLGLVGAIIVQENTLKLFCLSCRALGRKIENDMVVYLNKNHKITEIDFVLTKKNDCFTDLFDEKIRINKKCTSQYSEIQNMRKECEE